jgi:outer membrane protein TolC
VITLFAELWRLDRTKILLVESRALLTTAAEAAGARYESGEGIQEGVIRAGIAVRRLDVEIEQLALDRRMAELALGEAVGRADDPAFGPAGRLPDLAGPIDLPGLTAAGTASSPEVQEYASRERAAEVALEDARIQVKPTYSWMAAYQFRGGLDPMVMGGFSVKLPVWKERKQERAIAAAEIERAAAAHERAETELRASVGARGLAADAASLDLRLRLYRETIVPQSMAAFESANAAFGSGRAEMFLVLDDLDRWTGARREELTLSARRVEAIASLEAMTGKTLLTLPSSGRSQ